jgi:hypothetical protein
MKINLLLTSGLFVLVCLAGCSGTGLVSEAKYPTGADRADTGGDIYAESPSIFGSEGGLFKQDKEQDGQSGIEVNSFLWRAALDTVSFMPLASADPFGGVILTDWYSASETPDERFKLNIFILGRELRSDGIRVRVFKQEMSPNGWQDVNASASTARQLEDSILNRARQLKNAALSD